MQDAFQTSGGHDVPDEPTPEIRAGEPDQSGEAGHDVFGYAPPASGDPFAPQPDPELAAEPAAGVAADEPTGRAAASVTAKVTLLSQRLRAQESATARMQSNFERVESQVADISKRVQPMLETLSAELARQGATIESLRTDLESGLDLHAQRVTEFEQRLGSVLREMRELIAGKLESYDLALSDRLAQAEQISSDRLADFEERVEALVRRFAAESIPDEMRQTIEELSSRFVYAETALAATRSSVEFLRGEVGSLTMVVRKLQD